MERNFPKYSSQNVIKNINPVIVRRLINMRF